MAPRAFGWTGTQFRCYIKPGYEIAAGQRNSRDLEPLNALTNVAIFS
jgi:hypothetical protein